MGYMRDLLILIRYKNLIIIGFIQWMMHTCIIYPLLVPYKVPPATPDIAFWLLICSSVLIAAGGYVINDYFDVRIDEINRPGRVVVGRSVTKRVAMRIYQLLTVVGLLIGLGLALWARNVTFGFLFLAITGLLWFYSASYKRQFLVGNLIVALVAALVPFMVGFMEIAFLRNVYGELLDFTPLVPSVMTWIGGFTLFAFLVTLLREVVKDMEDVDGDREMECRTMPVVWGLSRTKLVVYGLVVVILVIAGGFVFTNHFPNDSITLRYYLVGIVMPLACFVYIMMRAKEQRSLHQASSFLKFIMIVGICYSLVFYFLQARTYGFPLFNLFLVNQPSV